MQYIYISLFPYLGSSKQNFLYNFFSQVFSVAIYFGVICDFTITPIDRDLVLFPMCNYINVIQPIIQPRLDLFIKR